MDSFTKSVGLENRNSILPTPSAQPMGPGLLGPNYSFADNLPLPGQVGVRNGDDLESVTDSVKAVAYYVDMIGFGESSSGMSRGVGPGGGPKPLGVNTWMKTGLTCSNGADMWTYNQGVPTGEALGKTFKKALEGAGFPGIRGLAPGIIEDAQTALNPLPIMNTIFGSGFPRCSYLEQEVGDQDGRTTTPDGKSSYVDNPETVYKRGSKSYQKRWSYDSDLTQAQWNAQKKDYCPDGYLVVNHKDSNCKLELQSRKEAFCNESWMPSLVLTAAILGGLVLVTRMRRV